MQVLGLVQMQEAFRCLIILEYLTGMLYLIKILQTTKHTTNRRQRKLCSLS